MSQANNGSRWKRSRRAGDNESADIERPLQMDKLELKPVPPPTIAENTAEPCQIRRYGDEEQDKESKVKNKFNNFKSFLFIFTSFRTCYKSEKEIELGSMK